MSSNAVARRYAAALFAAAHDEQQVDAVAADLEALATALAESPELATIWYHQQLTAGQKSEMLAPVLDSMLTSKLSGNLVALLFAKGRESQITAINEDFHAAVRDERQEVLAEVTVTRELSSDEQSQLADLVKNLTDCRTVILQPRIDKRILGGIIVRVGDRVYDGSLARRLDNLRRRLMQAQVKQAGVSS